MHPPHPAGQLADPRQREQHSEHHFQRSARSAGLKQRTRQPAEPAGDAKAPDHSPVHVAAQQPEALGRAHRVRNRHRCDRELGADLKRQDRGQQAPDAKSAHGRDATSEDSGKAEEQEGDQAGLGHCWRRPRII